MIETVSGTAIMWFRRDLRLADNAALSSAAESAQPVAALFVTPPQVAHSPGLASSAWLAHSLSSLDSELRSRGSSLTVRSGGTVPEVLRFAEELQAGGVYCQRDWTPAGMAEERMVDEALRAVGIGLQVCEGQLLVPPDQLSTAEGTPYRVFTPFYRAWLRAWGRSAPMQTPDLSPSTASPPLPSVALEAPPGAPDVLGWWQPGERGAARRLSDFAEVRLEDYAEQRDFPAEDSTSRLSPHLAWGELSPRQVAEAALEADEPHAAAFVRQLAWREFAYHVLHHNPSSSERPLDPKFEAFPWREDRGALESWKAGRTGFPLVDAGMRQLAASGWMHNRVRLLCASFLTKDLLVPWQQGEEHFRQQLVDYDPAINPFNWQWVAGSGADAAPYFRVFSPSRQAERFDPQAAYIREWVPELARLSERRAREPWRASREELADAGVSLGDTYPERIIDHAEARERALAAFSAIRRTG